MGSETQYATDMLFSQADFVMGAGSVLSLDGSYFKNNASPSGEEADYIAIKSDWGVVGQELKKALSTADKSND